MGAAAVQPARLAGGGCDTALHRGDSGDSAATHGRLARTSPARRGRQGVKLQRAGARLSLAGPSASRRAVLAAAGLVFEVCPSGVDEAAVKRSAAGDATAVALLLADLKAQAVARMAPDALVIGADQILVCDGARFDKPDDADAAARQLRALRGKTHELATAVVCFAEGVRIWQ